MCSWDEKAPAKIQKALEQEILEFTKEVQEVHIVLISESCYIGNT